MHMLYCSLYNTMYIMLISKNLDPDVILKVSEMDPEMEPVKFSGKIYRKNQVND